MIKRSLFAVSVGSLVLLLEASGHDRVSLAAQTAPAPSKITSGKKTRSAPRLNAYEQ